MSSVKIEVCAYTLQSAINAEKAGASRVELCDNFFEGGTTPSYGVVELARKYISIELNVLIRPRGGDFCYSDLEFETMLKDIYAVKRLGVNGIAIGALTANGQIDKIKMKEIISIARPASITFHRAFDCVKNEFDSLNELIELGVERVLTSGLKNTAVEGKETLAKLVEKSQGKIVIMPGGGINYSNIEELINVTKASEYHLSGKRLMNNNFTCHNSEVRLNSTFSMPEFSYIETDGQKIKSVVDLLNKF